MVELIPVFGPDDRPVGLIKPAEIRWYETAPNAKLVRRRKDNLVVRINLRSLADNRHEHGHRGDPRKYSHDHETRENPPRVWTMRRLGSSDPSGEAFVARIFRASVLDNLKQEAA